MEQNLAMHATASGLSPAALEPQVRAATRGVGRPADAKSAAQAMSGDEAQKLVNKAQDALTARGVDLKLTVSTTTDQIQVEVRDASSDKLICKLPPDRLVDMEQNASGLLDRPA
jgi:uncharacterized FlaG/YvyC family protein